MKIQNRPDFLLPDRFYRRFSYSWFSYRKLPLGSSSAAEDILKEEGFSHEDVIEDIEDGTSSVLSSSLSEGSHECLAFRAPWATPPTATFEGNKLRPDSNPGLQNNPAHRFQLNHYPALTPTQYQQPTLHHFQQGRQLTSWSAFSWPFLAHSSNECCKLLIFVFLEKVTVLFQF